MLFSAVSFSAMAARSSWIPGLGVYFVIPERMARIAASQIGSGVLKSGSPAANETTSMPSDFNLRARAVIASVGEGLRSRLRAESSSEDTATIIPLAIIQSVQRTPKAKLLFLALVAVVALLLHVAIGSSAWISPLDVIHQIAIGDQGQSGSPENVIIWQLRLARAVGCGLVGFILGAVGSAFQALFRNPLAEPYVVGVSSGAAVGGTLAIWLGLEAVWGGLGSMPFAFLGGMGSLMLVVSLSRRRGVISVPTLLLVGVVLSAVLSGVLSWILVASGQDTNRLVQWLLGTTANLGWSRVTVLTVITCLGIPYLAAQAKVLNAFSVSEESALRLGVDTRTLTWSILTAGSAMAAIAVAATGIIGFVGLVGPHISRRILGPDLRWSLMGSALLGSALLLLADIVAQRAVANTEVPIGAVTAVLGAPMLLVLLRKRL